MTLDVNMSTVVALQRYVVTVRRNAVEEKVYGI